MVSMMHMGMWPKWVFERVGLFDETLRVGEDGEFGRRMAAAGIPVHLFLRKRILHYDARTSLDYFRQRIRYGRSYIRSGIAGPAFQTFSKRHASALNRSHSSRSARGGSPAAIAVPIGRY